MKPELSSTRRNAKFHTLPDLTSPEGTFGPRVPVEVIERNGPFQSIYVRELDGDREGWVSEGVLSL